MLTWDIIVNTHAGQWFHITCIFVLGMSLDTFILHPSLFHMVYILHIPSILKLYRNFACLPQSHGLHIIRPVPCHRLQPMRVMSLGVSLGVRIEHQGSGKGGGQG